MEVEELVGLTKNLYDHLHLKKRINLTNDEYKLSHYLLSNKVDLGNLLSGLSIVKSYMMSNVFFRVSKRQNE